MRGQTALTTRFKSKPKQDAVAMVARGMSRREICAELGVDPRTVDGWLQDPAFQDVVEAVTASARGIIRQRIAGQAEAAIDTVATMAGPLVPGEMHPSALPGAAVRLKAALEILDRAGYVRKSEQPVINIDARSRQIRPEVIRALIQMNPEELRQLHRVVVDVEARAAEEESAEDED